MLLQSLRVVTFPLHEIGRSEATLGDYSQKFSFLVLDDTRIILDCGKFAILLHVVYFKFFTTIF